jgi:hypothetical protein
MSGGRAVREAELRPLHVLCDGIGEFVEHAKFIYRQLDDRSAYA